MRAFFDDMLAAIFVLAVLAASYIFLFMGTVQSGTMMSTALQHRIKIEQLQSATQAFRHITEPNTGENLAYLVGIAASTGDPRVPVGGQAVDTVAATESVLEQLLGPNYQLSIELPSRQIDLVFIVAQSPTMIEERDKLLDIIPELRKRLDEKQINSTIFVYFLSHGSCIFEWCDNSTRQIVGCSQLYLPPMRGESNYNIGGAISYASQIQGLGLTVVIPLTDSLSTGDAPDSCFSQCNTDQLCSWCSVGCPSVRSDSSLRSAALQAQKNRIAVCPIQFPKCSFLSDEAQAHFSCIDIPNIAGACPSCEGCKQERGQVCFTSCKSELVQQLDTLAQAAWCKSSFIQTSDLLETILEQVDMAVVENKFRVGQSPPKGQTRYSEELVLPVTPPLKARLTIW